MLRKNKLHKSFFLTFLALGVLWPSLALADEAGIPLPLAKATFEQYEALKALGLGDLDKSAVAELTFPGRAGTSKD